MKRTLSLWLPLFIWMGIIFWLSSIPKLEVAEDPVINFITRKLGHITEYGVLFLLFNRAFEGRRPVLSFLLSFLYGVSDEIHQIFVPLREGAPTDVIVDSIGSILGWLVAHWRKWIVEPDE